MERKVLTFPVSSGASDAGAIEHMLASGEITPAQMPSTSTWSREKKLAAASFTSALINIRDYAGATHGVRRREVAQDVAWVMSEDTEWPYSFVRLCELFAIEPDWVRARVQEWLSEPRSRGGQRFSAHRHAA